MTHQETIRALDELIVYLKSALLDVKLSRNFKDNVIRRLREINVSNTTMYTVANIEIEDYNSNSLSHYVMDLQHLEKERIERNKQSIQSIIDILTKEQEWHKQILIQAEKQITLLIDKKNLELQETAIAEQKKGNRIMIWTLWATAVGITISIVIAICK